MATWKEIDRIRKDAVAMRDIAKRLLKLPKDDFTDWEINFLQDMARHNGEEDDLTTRQSEKLLQIRDDTEFITEIRGFSVKIVLRKCYEARLDHSESDEDWIVEMFRRSEGSIKRKYAGRLMRCARELNIVEEEFAD
jgi:hypothetical protein